MIELFFLALALWLAFNLLAPWSLLVAAEPLSLGRVPPDLAREAARLHARFYVARLARPGGLSVLAWPQRVVLLDRDSLALTPAWALRFLVAHELGHVALGHLAARWWLAVTGLALLPVARWWTGEMEREADRYAERLTGLSAGSFYNRGKEINA